MKNKYYQILEKILKKGKVQNNKKGNIKYLLDEQLKLYPSDLLEIFEGHTIARNKLKTELQLFFPERRKINRKIQRSRYQLVGLLRTYAGKFLSNLL